MFSPGHAVSLAARKVPERQTQPAAQVPVRGKTFLFRVCLALGNNFVRVLSTYMWNRPAISRAIIPTLPFFPRIYKNVYCSGTTIKLTILHKDPSVKGFSCVFSHFCAFARFFCCFPPMAFLWKTGRTFAAVSRLPISLKRRFPGNSESLDRLPGGRPQNQASPWAARLCLDRKCRIR